MRADVERVYVSLHQFRTQLATPRAPRRIEVNRRRLDILASVKAAIDAMAESFESGASGLSRLREFGAEVRAGEGYRRLAALLDYHDNLSTLDLRVRIGLDGRVRDLEMLSIPENERNWFYSSPLGRVLGQFAALFRCYLS